MRVLVAYASRHGATAGIAERIGSVLADEGIAVDVRTITDVRVMERGAQLDRYDAFVVGSAVYGNHWLGDARDFVRRNARLLITYPVWMFGSGPLGDTATDDKGNDLMKPPPEMVQLADEVAAKESRIFFGAYDPTAKPMGLMEHLVRLAPASKEVLPHGDFRNWQGIEEFARTVARELTASALPA